MSNKSTYKISFPLMGLTFLVLLVLKIMEVGIMPTVSWWWVFAPLWLPMTIFFVILIFLLIAKIICEIL